MMEKIKNVLFINNQEYQTIDKISDMKKIGPNAKLIVDISLIINLFYNCKSELQELMSTNYILIIGENIDEKLNTFMGWGDCEPLNQLNFSSDNILMKIIQKSSKITYQNNKLFQFLSTIKNQKQLQFFPIDGYKEEDVILNNKTKKDIDVLFYGAMCYQRRLNVITKLSTLGPINYVICNNIFDNDDLIDRAKIILHVNSIDNCYHIPFAKIVKLLTNNKIILVEQTQELMTSEIINYVKTFDYNQQCGDVPSYISMINQILKNYDLEQKILDDLNPRQLMKNKYNFGVQVKNLLDI